MNSVNVNNQLDVMNYRANMLHRDVCLLRSRVCLKAGDNLMAKFWGNAAYGFEHRALDTCEQDRLIRLRKEIRLAKVKYNVPMGYLLCDGSEHSEVNNVQE